MGQIGKRSCGRIVGELVSRGVIEVMVGVRIDNSLDSKLVRDEVVAGRVGGKLVQTPIAPSRFNKVVHLV